MAVNLVKQLSDVLAKRLKKDTFDILLSNLKFISASDGSVLCEFEVEERHQNQIGTLHGGMTASLVDSITSFALLTKNLKGVSMDLNVSYLSAVKVGQVMQIDAKVLKSGKNIAFLTVDIKDKSTNRLVATGRHTKFITQ